MLRARQKLLKGAAGLGWEGNQRHENPPAVLPEHTRKPTGDDMLTLLTMINDRSVTSQDSIIGNLSCEGLPSLFGNNTSFSVVLEGQSSGPATGVILGVVHNWQRE